MAEALSLREQLNLLENLQEIDLNIRNLETKRDTISPDLKKLESLDAISQKNLTDKEKLIGELERLTKQTEAAILMNNDRVDRTSKKISDVQNQKEYQAASTEMTQLQKLHSELATKKETTAKDLEEAKSSLEEIKNTAHENREQLEKKQAEISKEVAVITTDLNELLKQREEFVDKIEKKILKLYDRIRSKRSGVGLVPAISGRCQGCNMHLPPQLFNEIQKCNEVMNCPSCHRILFWPSEKPSKQEEESLEESDQPRMESVSSK